MKSCLEKVKCPICGRAITKINLSKHLKAHERNNIKIICSHTICQYCGKIFETASGCGLHERYCVKNPNKVQKIGHPSWNKGKTKETDARIVRNAKNISKSRKGKPGHKLTDEIKQKISVSRKKYLKEHPDQVPFKLNHSSKESYPESYFRKWLIKEQLFNINEYQVSHYTLDFAWPDKKIYLEVDGDQHKLAWMIKHDKIRTDFLANAGWTCIHRIQWSSYQKLNKREKHLYLINLKELILSAIKIT